jgi:hypothetical protein
MNTYVFTKTAGDISASQAIELNTGETISSIVQNSITPADGNPPVLTVTSGLSSTIAFTVSGGNTGVNYGIPLIIRTNLRVIQIMIAVSVESGSFDPYPSEDPDSYQDLVGDLEAGKSALATAIFQLPPDLDPSGGYVMWDLLDDQGIVYASGNAYEYKIQSSGVSNVVVAKAIINAPADIPPTVDNPYQLRYTLKVADKVAYSYENLTILGFPTMQLGSQDSVEMQGDVATISLVTEKLFKYYTMELWADNTKLASLDCGNPERISNGYFVAGSIDTSALSPTLRPYQVVWKFYNTPAQVFRESSTLWIVNSSIIQAVEDVKSKVNKARQTLYGTADSQFPSTDIMKWLRRGMDAFNSSHGVLTGFTMTNAMGGVREFWLMYAEKMALDSQYLLEGEKAFNFSGAAISLDVDRTSFLDSMSSKIQGILDNEVKPFKQNLIIKGNSSGDGSGPDGQGGFNRTQRGAMGSVGILITPASLFGGWVPFPQR